MITKLASILVVGLGLAACQQTPPAQAPQNPPQPAPAPMPPGPPGPMMGPGFGPGGPHAGPPGWGMRPGGPGADRDDHFGPGMRGEGPPGFDHGGPPMTGHEGMGRGPGPEGGREMMKKLGALGVHFYPPPMLLRRGTELGLTPDQISKIRQEMLSAETRAVDLKAKIARAKVEVVRLLTADKVDERAVGAQIDEASKAGAELHKLQLGVMLHVRALLTADQVKKLQERRRGPENMKPGLGRRGRADMSDDDDDGDDD